MFIRNAWYVGAWGHELTKTNMLSRKLLGETLPFFRASTGDVAVMRDRCSHRFAPLSIGRREGDCDLFKNPRDTLDRAMLLGRAFCRPDGITLCIHTLNIPPLTPTTCAP